MTTRNTIPPITSEGELDPHTGAPAEGRTVELDDDPESSPARRRPKPGLPSLPHVCPPGETWVEHDGRGIPLVRVCAVCVEEKLARYRPEILAPYTQADVDERTKEEDVSADVDERTIEEDVSEDVRL